MENENAKPTIDLLLATKAVIERDLKLGLVTENQLRFTVEARKETAKKLAAEGFSTRDIAAVTGADQSTIVRDLRDANASENDANASKNGANAPKNGANAPSTKAERRAQREAELASKRPEFSDKPYRVIYADPPWRFEPYSRDTGMDRAADNHYPTMTLEQIKALKVPADNDCVLFLWATAPMLPEAMEVMKCWGFIYKSRCIWYKHKLGTGYWFRDNAEELLVGTRGNIPAPAMGMQYPSVISARQTEHSAKPFCFREMIEDLFPGQRRLEMFAREKFEGWDVWGNEVQVEAAE
jgi:N6-adenosine-specific RNA methylase IME4